MKTGDVRPSSRWVSDEKEAVILLRYRGTSRPVKRHNAPSALLDPRHPGGLSAYIGLAWRAKSIMEWGELPKPSLTPRRRLPCSLPRSLPCLGYRDTASENVTDIIRWDSMQKTPRGLVAATDTTARRSNETWQIFNDTEETKNDLDEEGKSYALGGIGFFGWTFSSQVQSGQMLRKGNHPLDGISPWHQPQKHM